MKFYNLKRYKGIFKYIQDGKRKYGYRLTYTDINRKRHEKSKRGYSSVQSAISEYRKLKPLLTDTDYNSLTVKQVCQDFLERRIKPNIGDSDKQVAISTYTSYQEYLKHIIDLIGNVPLIELTPTLYRRKCLNVLSDELSHKSVQDINTCFKTALNHAQRHGDIRNNSLKDVSPERSYAKPNREQLSSSELNKFHQTLAKQSLTDKVIFMTLEDTGMRAGELLGLSWKDIDFQHQVIYIRHTRDNNGIRSPKTLSSSRNLTVSKNLLYLYKQYWVSCKNHYYNINQNSLVIRSSRGKPISPSLLPKHLRILLHKAGLDDKIGHFLCHSFRHEFAGRLLENGVSAVAVSKYLGHKSPVTTLKFYARALPGKTPNLSSMIEKLNER